MLDPAVLKTPALIAALRQVVEDDGMLEGSRIDERRWIDVSGHSGAVPAIVLRPTSTAQVAAILTLCQAAGQRLVVQGGMTGLTDAALPHDGEWVLSLERMAHVSPAETDTLAIVAEAGATLQAVHDAAEAAGLMYGVDIGARGSCTIGGTIAVNAGGNRVLRYGMTRANVLGLEAVLPDGTIVSTLAGLAKDNTGYHWPGLLIGAEGTLGVVTRARLKLHAKPRGRSAAFCACASTTKAIAFLHECRRRLGPRLDAFEAMWSDYYGFVLAAEPSLRAPLPAGAAVYVLVEAAGDEPDDDEAQLQSAVMAAIEADLVSDAVVARSLADTLDFWRVREAIYTAARALEPVVGFDVSVPPDALASFVDAGLARAAAQWPRRIVFGHLGDGNLHVMVGVETDGADSVKALSQSVYGAVRDSGGSISAEHGIGVLKKPYLDFTRSRGDIEAMRRLRTALDPAGILNRGRIF